MRWDGPSVVVCFVGAIAQEKKGGSRVNNQRKGRLVCLVLFAFQVELGKKASVCINCLRSQVDAILRTVSIGSACLVSRDTPLSFLFFAAESDKCRVKCKQHAPPPLP